MKKRVLSIALVVAMIAIIAAGSFAYFTDKDSADNVFTVGNVKIDLIESQFHRTNAGRGAASTDNPNNIEPSKGGYLWVANAELLGNRENTPNKATGGEKWKGEYFSDDQIIKDAEKYAEYFDQHSQNMVPGSNVRKNPYVINTGANDAYIRVRVLVPVSLFTVIDNGPSYWTSTAIEQGEVTSKAVASYLQNGYSAEFVKTVYRAGIEYYEFDFTYVDPVKASEMTFWNVWGNIAIDENATAEELEDVESFNVIFEADAIQAEGFDNATKAFDAFDAQQQK